MRHDLRHLENGTIETKLYEIERQTRHRPPTKDEHGTYELYVLELQRRGQKRDMNHFVSVRAYLQYEIRHRGYSTLEDAGLVPNGG